MKKNNERQSAMIARAAASRLPTLYGHYKIYVYHDKQLNKEHVALVSGNLKQKNDVLVRIHSECITGDVFGSKRCDCGEQLHMSLQMISQQKSGILLYLRQEGRGIGLTNKIKSYALQERGLDTMTANHKLGFPSDLREYSAAAAILKDLKIRTIRLLTNNPDKINSFMKSEITCVERVPLEALPNKHNHAYLKAKREMADHMLKNI